MAKIVDDDFRVCSDCLQIIANDDPTGLNYWYTEQEAYDRLHEIESGLERAGGYVYYTGDESVDDEFSRAACDCCRTTLHGSRHLCIVMED